MPSETTQPARSPQISSFEEGLSVLGDIVARLESGSLGLTESIEAYERGVSILLIWMSLGGQDFDWISWTSGALVVAAVVVTAAAIWVEANVATDPVIPLHLFRERTLTLATIASVLIGVAMFGSTVYLSLYFQRAKDMSPTEAGLMSICMVGGLLVSSIVSGRVISATGVWKRWLVGGMVLVIAGIGLLSTIDAQTPLWHTGIFMAVLGLGLGATMQNLVLAVQNTIALADMGAGSSVVAFFRSLGGSVGIASLGAVLAHQVAASVQDGLTALVRTHPELAGAVSHQTGGVPDVSQLPAPIRAIFESAYGDATGHIFLVALPFAVGALIAVLFIKEVPLRTSVKREDELLAEVAPATPQQAATAQP